MATKIITGVKVPGLVTSISTAEWDTLLGELNSFWDSIGFVRTSDTGQIPLTGWVPASAAGGYEIRRFSGPLQTERPIFVKIRYGQSGTSATYGGITITVGSGSDGAGNLTGLISGTGSYGFSSQTPTLGSIYLSGDAGYLTFHSFHSDGNLSSSWFIERSVDRETGLPNSEGVTVIGRTKYSPSASPDVAGALGLYGARVAYGGDVPVPRLLYRVTMVPGGLYASPSFVDEVSLLRAWTVDSQGPLPLQNILGAFPGEHADGATFKVANVGPVKHTYRVFNPPEVTATLLGPTTSNLLTAIRWE